MMLVIYAELRNVYQFNETWSSVGSNIVCITSLPQIPSQRTAIGTLPPDALFRLVGFKTKML